MPLLSAYKVVMKKYIRFFFICGMIMFLSELWKQYCITFIINEHRYNWWYFPFQLCSIPMYLCLMLPFAPEDYPRYLVIADIHKDARHAALWRRLREQATVSVDMMWYGLLLFDRKIQKGNYKLML